MAGVKLRYFAVAIGIGIAFVPLFWTKFLSTFHRQRVLAIYYPEALSAYDYDKIIYQQQRCVNAIGSGRMWGDGLFKGTYTQSATGVPVNESDMVFTVVGEEFGFPVYSVVDVYDIIEYLEEDPKNKENVDRIKNYLAINGAKI